MILDGVSFFLGRGEVLFLLGSNGSGKSSLLRLCGRQVPTRMGTITLQGKSLSHFSSSALCRQIALLPQRVEASLFPTMNLKEHISLYLYSKGEQLTREIWEEHLRQFQPKLLSLLHTPACKLSGGLKQVFALALTLLSRPKILLLDEYTSALDPQTRREVIDSTLCWVDRHQIATMIATHHLSDLSLRRSRVLALREGRVIIDRPVGGREKSLSEREIKSIYA